MKSKVILLAAVIPTLMFAYSNCSRLESSSSQSSVGAMSGGTPNGVIIAGQGQNVSGTGASSVPTAMGIAARISNGLQGNVTVNGGNFAKAFAVTAPNLPKVTDPTVANGYDQIELLVYGACSDLATGSTPMMKSKYNVDPTQTIATNKTALMNAGVQMLNQYSAGLASSDSVSAAVNSTFSTLIQSVTNDTTGTPTSTTAFMAVCIAANTAGSSLLGF